MSETIYVEAVYGFKTREPYVDITWNGKTAQLSPDEARVHALRILACANAAEQDAFMVEFFSQKFELPIEKAAEILKELREWRMAREERQQ